MSSPRTIALQPEANAWPEPPQSDAYYGLAGRIVEAIAPHTEADRIAVLVQLLVAAGNAIGRGPHFRVESAKHHANLMAVLVGRSSKSRKGTSWHHVRTLLEQADPEWGSKCLGAGLSSGEGLIWAVRDPVDGRNVDAGVSDKRLLTVEEEFASVLRVATREGNTVSTTIRQAWDGGNLRSMTKNTPVRATGPHVSIIGHITRDELFRSLDRADTANGFANRIIWACVRRSQLLPEGGGFHAVDHAGFVSELRAAIEFGRQLGDVPLPRTDPASRVWHAVYERLSRERFDLAGSILSRAESQVVRISLIYALLDRAKAIDLAHLQAALALWEYVETSARFIFGRRLGDPISDDILGALRTMPKGLTRTQISEHLGRHRSAAQIGRSLERLREAGLATSVQIDTAGRPAERWFACEESEESEQRGAIFASFARGVR